MDRLRCDCFGVESDSGRGVEANSGLPGKEEGNVCMICGEVMESFSSAKDFSIVLLHISQKFFFLLRPWTWLYNLFLSLFVWFRDVT